jgi:NADP-dependent 3-hydroxy acid dehydrogenase YdfG
MKRIVLITGATAGIGEATARMFAAQGDSLILTGRREDRLESLKNELQKQHDVKVHTLDFDIRNKIQVEYALSSLPHQLKSIDILINNAGLASGLDPVHEADSDDWEKMIDTNIKGLLYVSRIVTEWMVKNAKGHVVNIGSIAGKEVYPNGNVYCATKHAVDALTKGMRMDLLEKGIRVSQVSPGAVETEFSMVRFKGDAERAEKVYQGYQPLRAEDVAEVVRFVTSQPRHVNISDVLVMPTAQASSLLFDRR